MTTDIDGPGWAGPDLDELLRLANGAVVEGPWVIWADLVTDGFVHVGDEAGVITEPDQWVEECNPVAKVYTQEDAEFIAAANPLVVAALVGELKDLRARVRAAEADRGKLADDHVTAWEHVRAAERERDDALRIAERHRAENDKLRGEVEQLTDDVKEHGRLLRQEERMCAEVESTRDRLRAELADAHRALGEIDTVVQGAHNSERYIDALLDIGNVLATSRPSPLADTEQAAARSLRAAVAEAERQGAPTETVEWMKYLLTEDWEPGTADPKEKL